MGIDGSTSINGGSAQLSSKVDLLKFHELRSKANSILIGGNTARNEPYERTPVPLVIISKSGEIPEGVRNNPLVNIWDLDPASAVSKAQGLFGPDVLVEGGIALLSALLQANLIQELFLTISAKTDGENVYDLNSLTRDFTVLSSEKLGDDTFLKLIRE
jgi:riboflavin biosynthesis pyrimidine reductase